MVDFDAYVDVRFHLHNYASYACACVATENLALVNISMESVVV